MVIGSTDDVVDGDRQLLPRIDVIGGVHVIEGVDVIGGFM